MPVPLGRRTATLFGRIKTFAVISFCCLFGVLLLFAPGAALKGARSGLTLTAEVVIPSLFPFLCLTSFVVKSGFAGRAGRLLEAPMRRLFRLPGCAAAALILGVIGGYPAGAAAAAGLCREGLMKKSEGDRLLCFCVNSGPAFIIGAVGAGLFGSSAVGMLLYTAHVAASLVIGFFLRFSPGAQPDAGRRRLPKGKSPPFAEAFVGSVTEASSNMLAIAAFVTLFACVVSLFEYCGILPAAARLLNRLISAPGTDPRFYTRILYGFFEVSNGCAAASGAGGMTALLLTSGILSWSGLSVQCQVMSAVGSAGLSIRSYVLTRVFHIALSVAFTYALFELFPSAVPAFASVPGVLPLLRPAMHSAPAAAALLMLTAMLLLSRLGV